MMCLGEAVGGGLPELSLGDLLGSGVEVAEVEDSPGDGWPRGKESGESGPLLPDSEISDGDGVLGGVSMDGMGWSLKQADS